MLADIIKTMFNWWLVDLIRFDFHLPWFMGDAFIWLQLYSVATHTHMREYHIPQNTILCCGTGCLRLQNTFGKSCSCNVCQVTFIFIREVFYSGTLSVPIKGMMTNNNFQMTKSPLAPPEVSLLWQHGDFVQWMTNVHGRGAFSLFFLLTAFTTTVCRRRLLLVPLSLPSAINSCLVFIWFPIKVISIHPQHIMEDFNHGNAKWIVMGLPAPDRLVRGRTPWMSNGTGTASASTAAAALVTNTSGRCPRNRFGCTLQLIINSNTNAL